ncbi:MULTISPECIES: hybrid sensor histidine kinase/response regulator [Olivibacter]|jgi:signal transduction histidine kinase|uniref:histidine kinase n=1 Tax=Olivibacter oleidegradans TaxID=760123 RepID=A0ABV6HNH4_9SPHI|nr:MULTISPECIES: hybrid sensor histidine kinase/response regulator [Olivibacter]QEL02934.1 hybrid sensor histidine kinase/response regulator [Olivibacter sp. LS-1]
MVHQIAIDKIKILYLDDELHSLHAFKAMLREAYEVFITTEEERAYELLAEHKDIRIVFSDQSMPTHSGTDFFEKISHLHPLPIRILVTGYSEDEQHIIDAINRGNIFRYLKKPWSIDMLHRVIGEANRSYVTTSLLQQKNSELTEAYAELDKFAYSVSHDMRGPLAGIMSAMQLLRMIDDPAEREEIVEIAINSAERLDRYIINLHDYYSVRRGQLTIAEINLLALKQELEQLYEAIANAKQIQFSISLQNEEPFRNDEMAIRLILTNLISNAFKYQKKSSGPKYVEVAIEVTKGTAVFFVRDNGIGIKEYYLDEIFTLFFRASLDEAGSGLGLYNVKSVVEQLGGQISVESTVDVGSTFKVVLPNK